MKKLFLVATTVLTISTSFGTPAFAVIDSGDGCGCIRPCIPIEKLL